MISALEQLKIDNEDALLDAALAPVLAAGMQARAMLRSSDDWDLTIASGGIEAVEQARSQGLSLTVYADDGRSAGMSTTDLKLETIRRLAQECLALAEAGAPDPASRLPETGQCGLVQVADLDDDGRGHDPDGLTKFILTADALARADARVVATHRSGASSHLGRWRLRTTQGVDLSHQSTRYALQLVVVAEQDHEKQMGWDVSSSRQAARLRDPETIAQTALRRATEGFGWRAVSSAAVPVVFDNRSASELLGLIGGLVSGSAIYRGASCWADQRGKQVASEQVTIIDDATLAGESASRPCDDEGVRSARLTVIDAGVVQHWLTDTYSATRLDLPLTGHAAGCSNLRLQPGANSREDLLRQMGTGLLVTTTQGHGVDLASGQWSKGVGGFWVENGDIVHPVQGITLAGRLQDLFQGVQAIGNDPLPERAIASPSLLVTGLTMGGA